MIYLILSKLNFFICFFSIVLVLNCNTLIKISTSDDEFDSRNSYYVSLLKLALDKTVDKYGAYEIQNIGDLADQKRIAAILGNGANTIDLMWTMTNIEREKDMLPIRIPLLKGLMGCRLIIINKNKQTFFSKINSVDDLKKLKAIQGHDWPDTDILLANGFKVETSANYNGMFLMISKGRGDYFPRAINEPFGEIKLRPNLNLIVDENIMLYYFAPIFFFVNTKKPELQVRIEEGLKLAISDGSFDNFFYNHESIKSSLKKIDFKKMKIFELNNPFLTKETKKIMDNKEYVLKIK